MDYFNIMNARAWYKLFTFKFKTGFLHFLYTVTQDEYGPFASLWSKPMGIHESISQTEYEAMLLTSLVQTEKD